jgi:uncharacterized membrane protein
MTKKVWWPVLGTIVMAVLTVIQEASADNSITAQEWVQVILGALMAFNVWATANLPQYTKMKTWVAAAIVVVGALYTYIVGGVSTAEIINMIVLFLAAVGVAFTPQPITTVINGRTVPADGERPGTNNVLA